MTDPTTEIVEQCRVLYEDLSFTAVKQWKERTGGRAVGFMPVYAPRELIHAAGMLPVGIMGGGENLEIIKGDAYFQSYICHIPRSTIELGVTGRLDCLDGMLFPAICDVIRNLSGMWQMLFKDKLVRYLDFPQEFTAGIGGAFYRHELEGLLQQLSALSKVTVTPERLRQSIALYNENRRVIAKLYDTRAKTPEKVPTYELYLVMRASNVLPVEEHTALVERYLAAAAKRDRKPLDNARVVVTGAFCEQPPIALIRALEASGCYVVDDDWVLGARYLLGDVKLGDDPLTELANAYLGDTVETASRYEPRRKKGAFLIDSVKKYGAEGVVFCAPSFCDPALLERPMLVEALNKAGVPHTSFNYAENTSQYHVFKEQTGTFADSIKLWGAA
ncbi:MAG: benzoyl-CoA reductase subunit C [Myxococcaceae bacterium]|nr:benzoyl-CoA reductase subunit C [Myxococcaceae bacterium]